MGVDEGAHGWSDMRTQVVPNDHDRSAQQMVGGPDQCLQLGDAEALLLPCAAVVGDGPVDQPGALPGFDADQAGQWHPPRTLAADVDDRGLPAAGPGASLRWSQALARLVDEADPRHLLAGDPSLWGQVSFTHVVMP